MQNRWWDLALIVALGAILPCILLSFISGNKENIDPKEHTEIQQTEGAPQIQDTIREELRINVLDDHGNVVNIAVEDYVLRVVLAEMPLTFEIEALKAQAVVARTYALRRIEGNEKHPSAPVCVKSACCQGYITPVEYLNNGGSESAIQKAALAVSETSGQVLVYNGELIEATYFSCSGGLTEDAAAVWGEHIPYLQSTQSPGEENAAHYVETVCFSADAFESLIGADLAGKPETWFGSITYTSGNGVDTMEIGGLSYKGTQLRQMLGLRSTAFTIASIGDTVAITTRGYGHRVGMSQYGADAMAVNGKSYRQILAHYYLNTGLITYGNTDNLPIAN